MPSQTIQNATIADVEAALVEQYGRNNVREKSRSANSAKWRFRITDKSRAKCVVTSTPGGVHLSMSPDIHIAVIIVTLIGYLMFIIPGVAMTIWIVVVYLVTAGFISSRFQKMVDAVKSHAQRATALSSKMPPPPPQFPATQQ